MQARSRQPSESSVFGRRDLHCGSERVGFFLDQARDDLLGLLQERAQLEWADALDLALHVQDVQIQFDGALVEMWNRLQRPRFAQYGQIRHFDHPSIAGPNAAIPLGPAARADRSSLIQMEESDLLKVTEAN